MTKHNENHSTVVSPEVMSYEEVKENDTVLYTQNKDSSPSLLAREIRNTL